MSKFELKKTSGQYVLEDASGYSFLVSTAHDPEEGWSASVTFSSYCMRTEDGAIDKVTQAVEHFLRMAKTADDVQPLAPTPTGDGAP